MKPLVTFPDPEAAVVLYLRGLDIADTVTPKFPVGADGKEVELPLGKTHLQVELEGGGVADYPVTERAQVRVTAHADRNARTAVKDLASLAHGHVCRLQSDDVAGVAPRIGRSDVITDPATKNLMCWFVVRVDLKAIVAS